ncbi:MAG: hypothetical protein IT557_00755 [Alphaproteobacteria bacterium]|nr:hypothetical protein [Alphaproteobacteria bacterium]
MPNRRAMLRAMLEAKTSGLPEAGVELPPGCVLEERIEQRDVLVADQPMRRERRHCARLQGCADPADDTDWVCGPWVSA